METITLPSVPSTVDEFISLRDEKAGSPEGGAAMFVLAMLMYTQNENLGNQAFTIASDRSLLQENMNGYKGFAPAMSFAQAIKNYFGPKPYIARSYVDGTTPESGYHLPSGSMNMVFSRNQYSGSDDGDVKVFVKCSGADSPRPVTLRANNKGIWKVINYSSLFVGVRNPVVVDDDL